MPNLPDLSDLLGGGKDEKRFRALEREFGATLIRQAEVDVLIGMIIKMGVISKGNFLDLLEAMLRERDIERRRAAGMM